MTFEPSPALFPLLKILVAGLGGTAAASLSLLGHAAAGHEIALVTAALVAALGARSIGDGLRNAATAAMVANVQPSIPPPAMSAEGPTK